MFGSIYEHDYNHKIVGTVVLRIPLGLLDGRYYAIANSAICFEYDESIVAILLLLCLADMPYGFYELVRFAAAGAFVC